MSHGGRGRAARRPGATTQWRGAEAGPPARPMASRLYDAACQLSSYASTSAVRILRTLHSWKSSRSLRRSASDRTPNRCLAISAIMASISSITVGATPPRGQPTCRQRQRASTPPVPPQLPHRPSKAAQRDTPLRHWGRSHVRGSRQTCGIHFGAVRSRERTASSSWSCWPVRRPTLLSSFGAKEAVQHGHEAHQPGRA